ncbi:hypothetical protein L2E82_16279 [Cichorium intybus]|uniref:Uncharacterized protein n=1 Tax=Cichorium intybus TaxID=13427 RepID=A0ACB9F6E8_CICIN|nr:hypothetical protein L2E82_16279 [Cichorium intybus]
MICSLFLQFSISRTLTLIQNPKPNPGEIRVSYVVKPLREKQSNEIEPVSRNKYVTETTNSTPLDKTRIKPESNIPKAERSESSSRDVKVSWTKNFSFRFRFSRCHMAFSLFS